MVIARVSKHIAKTSDRSSLADRSDCSLPAAIFSGGAGVWKDGIRKFAAKVPNGCIHRKRISQSTSHGVPHQALWRYFASALAQAI
ncbi:hypothetical protein EHS39_28555 [Ensifer sp. MPMI2T]|nr:hypothetical protein EHS39_28555 [Ensifer sp. MPMI2T]